VSLTSDIFTLKWYRKLYDTVLAGVLTTDNGHQVIQLPDTMLCFETRTTQNAVDWSQSRGEISHFFTPVKLGEMWAKCHFQLESTPNVRYTSGESPLHGLCY